MMDQVVFGFQVCSILAAFLVYIYLITVAIGLAWHGTKLRFIRWIEEDKHGKQTGSPKA